jgi:hypothetical protein
MMTELTQRDILNWILEQAKENLVRKYDYICVHEEDCSCNQESEDKVMIEKAESIIRNSDFDCLGNLIIYI